MFGCSVLHQPKDDRSKVQGVTMLHNPHQLASKNTESGRPQNLLSTSLTKGMATLDEFKYGFPSEGLSTSSNKWWGSSGLDDSVRTNTGGAEVGDNGKTQLEGRAKEADMETCETGKEDENACPQGTNLLTAVRKRAVEEGREALKLGVFKGHGVNKLSKREKILLLQIFRSSLPRSWIYDS